jgi:predicted metal-dependent hydrolase
MSKQEIFSIVLNHQDYLVLINRKDIKQTSIKVNEKLNIEVNTNKKVSHEQIKDLILKNQVKIIKMIENIQAKQLPSHKMAYMGRIIDIEQRPSKSFHYELTDTKCQIYSHAQKEVALDRFYKDQANLVFNDRLNHCFNQFNLVHPIHFPKLTIRKMKNRYGTCYYRKQSISLNLNLIKYEVEIIDYVIFHEICHFIHPNHSQAFYDLLAYFVPNHKILRTNLNKF